MDLDIIQTHCRPFLTSIHRADWCFTYFTAHDSSHSEAVLKIVRKIAAQKLTDYEMELLEVACLCHDIGMAKYEPSDKTIDNNDGEYCDYVRKNHHIRSESFVNQFKDEMGLTTEESVIIGKICYSHSSKVNLNEINNRNLLNNGFKLEIVRTRLLGAILRISDALDASDDRLPVDSYIEDATFESKVEYLKHLVITKVKINPEKILVELTKQPQNAVMEVKDKLREEFSSVYDVLVEAGFDYQLEFSQQEMEIDTSRLNFIPKDVERIMELYVKPSYFNEICEKLKKHNIVIISGDANVGKTSTANYIAGLRLNENKNPILIFRPGIRIQSPSNHTIIIDDAFGDINFENNILIGYNEIYHLKEENKVIITSRENVLIDALRNSRIGEADYEQWKVNLEQEGSYSNNALKEILHKHLNYYLKNGQIKEEFVEIVQQNETDIVNTLRFPHNIDIFVKEKLKDIYLGKDLITALEESKHVKRVAKNWFLSLDDARKFFVFTVWLFPTKMEFFKIIYPNIIQNLKELRSSLEIEDVNDLITRTSSYIIYDEEYGINEDRIHFRHQNYREGISAAIKESLESYISILSPLFQYLYINHGILLRKTVNDSLKRIATINKNLAFDLIEQLITVDNWKIKGEIALILGEFRYTMPDESIVLLKKLANDSDWRVREYVAEAIVFGFDNLIEFEHFIPDESYRMLKNLSSDPDPDVKSAVALSLGKFGHVWPEESIDLLKELSEEDDCSVKSAVALSLGKFGHVRPKESIDLLKELSNDKYWKVRKSVIEALFTSVELSLEHEHEETVDVGFLKFGVSIKILEKFINDEDWRVKEFLGRSLVMGLAENVYSHCYESNQYLVLLKELVEENDCRVKFAIAESIIDFGYLSNLDFGFLLNKLVTDDNNSIRKLCECNEISRILKENQDW